MEQSYTYTTNLVWTGEKKGTISSEGLPDLPVATPPEFNGHPGIWAPEQLLLASIQSCIMTTFLSIAEASRFEPRSLKSSVTGIIEPVEKKYQFTRIEIRAELGVADESQVAKGQRLLEKAEENCFISNSVKAEVKLTPVVTVG